MPHTKRKKKKKRNIPPLTIELINISGARPWLFMQAMRGLMRRSCKDNVLTKVGYLRKDKIVFQMCRISRALPGTRCHWSEPLETFRRVTAYEQAYLSERESTDVAPSDLLCQTSSRLICSLLSAHFELYFFFFCGERVMQINDTWWVDTKLRAWSCEFIEPQIDLWCCIEYLGKQNVRTSFAKGPWKKYSTFIKGVLFF